MSGASQTSRFLSLPRELRDLIYHNLINQHTPPPSDPTHAGERHPNTTSPCTIYYETKSPRPALLQLKLCNHQLHAEVNEAITQHSTHHHHGSRARLDIMLKASSIWPTWTHLPVTRTLDPVIDVRLRIFEATGWGSEFSTSAYRALWTLFRLLVFHGPCLNHSRGLPTPLDIARLKFEIVLCFPTSVDDLFGTYRDVFDRLEKLAFDNVGLGHVGIIEGCLGADRRIWKLKQLPTGLTFASRV